MTLDRAHTVHGPPVRGLHGRGTDIERKTKTEDEFCCMARGCHCCEKVRDLVGGTSQSPCFPGPEIRNEVSQDISVCG